MKNQLSIQEKLWDLRRDHDYKLEEVATAVNVVPATISKYENKENKEYNIVTLNKLADFLWCLFRMACWKYRSKNIFSY